MLASIKKRLARRQLDIKDCDEDDKDDLHAFAPPANYIKISQGKIQLVHQSKSLENDTIVAQDKKDKSQCVSPTMEKELREQLENMNRVIKVKESKQMQTGRDYKTLQTRFAKQESLLHKMRQENKALITRVRQYENCLDDVMRKVVDAIVAEDNLREEVTMLKSRVHDLEAQNAALSGSPAKGRDEGYCTLSSGQPQPSNGHLEDLPEEPEHWLLPTEPCSNRLEDWSMSQEELAVISLDDCREHQRLQQKCNGEHDWIWNSNDFLNSTMAETDSVSDGISQLLQQKIVYSEDEEVTCTEFTNDFYKLVNIRSGSARSLYSCCEGETDDEDDDDDDNDSSLSESNVQLRYRPPPSPTPSEAGRAQVTSCSSSETDDLSRCTTEHELHAHSIDEEEDVAGVKQLSDIEDVQLVSEQQCAVDDLQSKAEQQHKTELRRPPHVLVKSKSTIDDEEPSCILRNNQRREIENSVVRSGSANCGIAARVCATSTNVTKLQERFQQKPANSWRKSNGWKRVTSPTHRTTAIALVSTHMETKAEIIKSALPTQKISPTKIPIASQQLLPNANNKQQQQQSAARKSKIPPPVPIRRSYAS